MLLRSDPSADEVVTDGMRQRQVVVSRRGDVAVLDDGVVDMPAERLLDVGHVLHHGDAAHADLLPPIVVRLHLRRHLSSHLEMSSRPLHRPRTALLYANGQQNNGDTFRRPCQVPATLTGLVFASRRRRCGRLAPTGVRLPLYAQGVSGRPTPHEPRPLAYNHWTVSARLISQKCERHG